VLEKNKKNAINKNKKAKNNNVNEDVLSNKSNEEKNSKSYLKINSNNTNFELDQKHSNKSRRSNSVYSNSCINTPNSQNKDDGSDDHDHNIVKEETPPKNN